MAGSHRKGTNWSTDGGGYSESPFCTIAGNGFASTIQKGNPTMWIGAALALATLWRPAGVLVLLKPSLFPFALFGANRRGWWIALGVVALVSLSFLPMWPDYFRVVTDARGRGWEYSASEVPFLLIPLIAWAGRRRRYDMRSVPSSSDGLTAASNVDS